MPPTPRSVHHVGYWVDDLDQAMTDAREMLGVGPFRVIRNMHLDPFTFRGEPAVLDHSSAFTVWGSIFLELSEVHAVHPPALAAALDIRHGRVSHISWAVDDVPAEGRDLETFGCTLLTAAGAGRVGAQTDWVSGGPLFSHAIELHQQRPEWDAMWESLAALTHDDER